MSDDDVITMKTPAAQAPAAKSVHTAKHPDKMAGFNDHFDVAGSEALKRTSDTMNRVTTEYMSICSDNANAFTKSSNITSGLIRDINKRFMDSYSSALTEVADLSKEAMQCRQPDDVMKLQKRAMDSFSQTLTDSIEQYGQIFEAFSKAYEPITAQTTASRDRFLKALAA